MTTLSTIAEVLEREGVYVGVTSGVSMWPMIRDRCDTVVVRPPCGRLRRFDVALYKRDDRYVLHRVVEVLADSYVICGDNCIGREHDITDADVLGVLTGFYRGETQVNMQGTGYRCYVRAWCGAYPGASSAHATSVARSVASRLSFSKRVGASDDVACKRRSAGRRLARSVSGAAMDRARGRAGDMAGGWPCGSACGWRRSSRWRSPLL